MVSKLSIKVALASWEIMNEPEGSILIGSNPENPCFDTSILLILETLVTLQAHESVDIAKASSEVEILAFFGRDPPGSMCCSGVCLSFCLLLFLLPFFTILGFWTC